MSIIINIFIKYKYNIKETLLYKYVTTIMLHI